MKILFFCVFSMFLYFIMGDMHRKYSQYFFLQIVLDQEQMKTGCLKKLKTNDAATAIGGPKSRFLRSNSKSSTCRQIELVTF